MILKIEDNSAKLLAYDICFHFFLYFIISFLCTGGAYYVPHSCLLISNKFKFCTEGERPEQGDQVPLCTCSSTPLSMGPETSLMGSCA